MTEPEKKTVTKAARMLVHKTYSTSGKITKEEEDEDIIEVKCAPAGVPIADVSYMMGNTFNMGDFNSIKIECMVRLPCVLEEIDDAGKTARRMVQKRLEEDSLEIREARKKRGL